MTNTIQRAPVAVHFFPVGGICFGRQCYVLYGSVGCVSSLDVPLASEGQVHRLAPEAPQKGDYRRDLRHFQDCRTRLGYGPATGPTLKTAFSHTCTLVRRMTNTALPHGRILFQLVVHAFAGRVACCTFRSGVSHHWIYLWLQGAVPPGLNPPRRS